MATRKTIAVKRSKRPQEPKELPPLCLTPNQCYIARDTLEKIIVERKRLELYVDMQMRRGGPDTATHVRFVDQETHREVFDVPVRLLIDKSRERLTELNAELLQFCRIVVELPT